MAKRPAGTAKPRITLTAADHEKLSALAEAALHTMPDVARELAEELDRAHILPGGKQRADAVHMGCDVDFRDDTTGRVQTVTLVYPHEADIAEGKDLGADADRNRPHRAPAGTIDRVDDAHG